MPRQSQLSANNQTPSSTSWKSASKFAKKKIEMYGGKLRAYFDRANNRTAAPPHLGGEELHDGLEALVESRVVPPGVNVRSRALL